MNSKKIMFDHDNLDKGSPPDENTQRSNAKTVDPAHMFALEKINTINAYYLPACIDEAKLSYYDDMLARQLVEHIREAVAVIADILDPGDPASPVDGVSS